MAVQIRLVRDKGARTDLRAESYGGREMATPLSGFASSGNAGARRRSDDMNNLSLLGAVASAFWHQVSGLTHDVADGEISGS